MDTPAQPDPGLGPRVARLESDVTDLKVMLGRIEARLDTALPTLATSAQIAELRGDLSGQIAELRGRMNYLPTSWQMMTAIVGGQVALAALMAAIVFGVARVMGHG
jgi:hypothetical protein